MSQSNAIEVLKNMRELFNMGYWTATKERDIALGEALLALEKQEIESNSLCSITNEDLDDLNELERKAKVYDELKEWLEKEIEIIKQTQEEYGNKVLHEEIRKNILKEVLERVGEQK